MPISPAETAALNECAADTDRSPASASAGESEGTLVRCSHQAMATMYQVFAVHSDETYARQAAMQCFEMVDRLEMELSRFRSNSDISRLNRARPHEVVPLGWSTRHCLQIALHLYACTGGAFDPSRGTGLPDLELLEEEPAARVGRAGLQLDLGAIGKGFAVDCMAAVLLEWGIRSALIHGGQSSVMTLDPPPGQEGWLLTFSRPSCPGDILLRLTSSRQAMGGSGLSKGPHIIDPRQGQPAQQAIAAWVWGNCRLPGEGPDLLPGEQVVGQLSDGRLLSASEADGLSTAMMNLQPDEMLALQERYPGLQAMIVRPDGEVRRYGAESA